MAVLIKNTLKNTMLLAFLLLASCGTPVSTERAVADKNGKALGLVQTEVSMDGKPVQVWQFLLCDLKALLDADAATIPKLLADEQVCYNPLLDKQGGAAVYLALPSTRGAAWRSKGRWAVRGLMVVGGGVLAFFSVRLGLKIWKWFSSMEDYIRHSMILKREKAAQARFEKGLKPRNRFFAWLTGGGVVGFFTWFYLVGDGAFETLRRMWAVNKTYYNNGKKVLFEWGQAEQSYIDNYPYLNNDAWQNTKKVTSIDTLLLGIKKSLGCEFSQRYLSENPLRAP